MTMKKRYIPPAFQTVAFSPNSPLCASGEIWNGSDITDPTEFKWHRDLEDRIVEPIGETDWMVQLENQLPQKLEGRVFIPMKMWHRVIKGSGDLRIKLTKLKNNI